MLSNFLHSLWELKAMPCQTDNCTKPMAVDIPNIYIYIYIYMQQYIYIMQQYIYIIIIIILCLL